MLEAALDVDKCKISRHQVILTPPQQTKTGLRDSKSILSNRSASLNRLKKADMDEKNRRAVMNDI